MRSRTSSPVRLLGPATVLLLVVAAWAEPGEAPALGTDRITQEQIEQGLSIQRVAEAGMRVFTAPFNRLDGYGDGPVDPADTTSPGGRPTLQGNGMLLRMNGLDAQSCLECHAQISAATVPPLLGIGGAGGSSANAIIAPTSIDLEDLDTDGNAAFNGRFANPPFVFGAGAVELLALEMTQELLGLRDQALANPNVPVPLVTKGVSFGTIIADGVGNVDSSNVEGVDADLVVRPFGRKGGFATGREFATGAMQFHFGMQPVEVPGIGEDFDADGDGVVNEILVGELSALSVFMATLDRPFTEHLSGEAQSGRVVFDQIGCASCHIPELNTSSRELPLRQPEVPTDPSANVYMTVDLSRPPAHFEKNNDGGIRATLFADLKRHDMGSGLAEDFALASDAVNREFTTARLWGIADSAPYLHDGRATTLTDAIVMHGGEAQSQRDAFAALGDSQKQQLLAFLRSLRTPQQRGRSGTDFESVP